MPRYDYFCEANGQTVEVIHSIRDRLGTWARCAESTAAVEPGTRLPKHCVRRVILTAPMANMPAGNSQLKNLGFTKLEKRYDGTYENVTRSGTESRFLDPGDKATLPHFNKKISD
ncbi:MAG: zinc ribbon domain-containing protein [Gammaproteobacteria bacterium]|nr:zinc ribbon domain-containing protein [Gammaproteobacteria bacterium]